MRRLLEVLACTTAFRNNGDDKRAAAAEACAPHTAQLLAEVGLKFRSLSAKARLFGLLHKR